MRTGEGHVERVSKLRAAREFRLAASESVSEFVWGTREARSGCDAHANRPRRPLHARRSRSRYRSRWPTHASRLSLAAVPTSHRRSTYGLDSLTAEAER